MSEDTRRRAYAVFTRAVDLDTADRGRFVRDECGSDAALLAEVEDLLSAHRSMDRFMETPAREALGAVPDAAAADLGPGFRIGAYRIERVLGRGGAGVVYEAVQERPRRRVALKVMRSLRGSAEARRRFLEEAEVLARVHHPHVAGILEAGLHEHEGVQLPYVAVEFVADARTVLDYAAGAGLSVRDRVELFATICDAVHHGHQKGVLHRDLKPDNLLVTQEGRAKVIDFGVARVEGAAPAAGEIVGTPPYMSPEQCVPGAPDLDVRSDVYSLGAVLFELLSGRRHLDVAGLSLAEALERIAHPSPLPGGVLRGLGRDLGSVVSKALHRDPRERYPSAAALADDLRRFLGHRPVEAHPGSAIGNLRKFVRRQPLAAGALLAVLLVSVVGAIVGGVLAHQKERQRLAAEYQSYLANVAAAAGALGDNDVGEARRRLELAPRAFRHWEWRYLRDRCDTSSATIAVAGGIVRTGALSPRGDRLALSTSALGGAYRVQMLADRGRSVSWSVEAGRRRADSLGFSPDGARLAIGYHDGHVEIRDAASGDLHRGWLAHGASDDPLPLRHVNGVVFGPEGAWLASAGGDGTVRIWDIAAGTLHAEYAEHADRVIALALHPRGDRLVSGSRDGRIHVWNVADVTTVQILTGHTGSVECVDVSSDGGRVVSGSRDRTAVVWNLASGRRELTVSLHSANVSAARFAPDGESVVTASWDRTVGVHRVRDGATVARLRGHTDRVVAAHFDRRTGELVSFSRAPSVKRWSLGRDHDDARVAAVPGFVRCLGYDPDGARLFVATAAEGRVHVFDAATHVQEFEIRGYAHRWPPFVVSPDGARLFLASPTRELRSYSVATGDLLARLPKGLPPLAWLDADQTLLAVSGASAMQKIHLADESPPTVFATGSEDYVVAVAVTRLGEAPRFATLTARGELALWDARATDEPLATRTIDGTVARLVFRPGAREIAVASWNRVMILDAGTLETRLELRGHAATVRAMDYTPDGARLATGSRDGSLRIWDADTGEPVLVLPAPALDYELPALVFDPTGRVLACAYGTSGVENFVVLRAAGD